MRTPPMPVTTKSALTNSAALKSVSTMAGLVREASEDAEAAQTDSPVHAHDDVSSTENGAQFDRGLVLVHAGLREIHLDSAERRRRLCGLEMGCGDAPLAATEYRQ